VIHRSSFGEGMGGGLDTNEPAVIHRSSFGEGMEGGFDPFYNSSNVGRYVEPIK
jgi:hypothetical protein